MIYQVMTSKTIYSMGFVAKNSRWEKIKSFTERSFIIQLNIEFEKMLQQLTKLDSRNQVKADTYSHEVSRTAKNKTNTIQHETFRNDGSAREILQDQEFKKYGNINAQKQGARQKKKKLPHWIVKPRHENNGEDQRIEQDQNIKDENTLNCPICNIHVPLTNTASISECGHLFCQSCLQYYVLYQIGVNQQVYCPDQSCREKLVLNGPFFNNLPFQVQKKYRRIHLFYSTIQQKNKRLCPNEKCEEGVLTCDDEDLSRSTCQSCKQTFCLHCFFPVHDGACKNNEIQFIQSNLKYRQCKFCKVIVEKSDGCNHMACTCGHHFCYLCGKKWSTSHNCSQDLTFCSCLFPLNDMGVLGKLVKIFIMSTIFFPSFILYLLILLAKSVVILSIMFIISLIGGILYSPIAIIIQQYKDSRGKALLLIIAYPLTIFLGILKAMNQIWWQFCKEDCISNEQGTRQLFDELFKW